MACTICNQQIHQSGNVRPNTAYFECGHQFHLSCVLNYSKERFTNMCPTCKPADTRCLPNFGQDRLVAIETLISARREARDVKPNVAFLGGITSWFGKAASLDALVSNGTSLNTLRLQGYMPEDFIENQITWKKLCKVYKVDSLIDFGCRWHHMIVMGFCPEDFKTLSWQQLYTTLNVRAADMLKTSITVRQLSELNYSIQNIKQLGFTWSDLTNMGGNVKTLRLLTPNLDDLKTYFDPTHDQLVANGFCPDAIKQHGWKSETVIPVRQKRPISMRGMATALDF